MRRCRFHVIMPNVPGTSASFSKLSQPLERMKLAELSIGLSIWPPSNGGLSTTAEIRLRFALS
jgi:hypothetical protein